MSDLGRWILIWMTVNALVLVITFKVQMNRRDRRQP